MGWIFLVPFPQIAKNTESMREQNRNKILEKNYVIPAEKILIYYFKNIYDVVSNFCWVISYDIVNSPFLIDF